MKFIRFPSIENTYRDKFINVFLGEFPELEGEIYTVTEKVHGSSLQLAFSPGELLRIGRRTAWLEPSEKFYGGVREALVRYAEPLDSIQEFVDAASCRIRLFGELCGPGIRKGVDYGPQKQILFFGLAIGGELQPFRLLETFAATHSLLLVPAVGEAHGLRAALDFDPGFNSLVAPGLADNIAEGIVIQPLRKVYRNAGGHTFLLKKKNEEFKERAQAKRPPSPGDPEAQRLNEEFRLYLTDGRLRGIFSKRGEIEGPQQIGQYIRWMLGDAKKDFLKDHGDDFAVLDKAKQKQVLNVGGAIANMLKGYL